MCLHIIAIDAGGSKTKAVIKNRQTQQTFELNVGGASLSHDLSSACLVIKKLILQLVQEAEVELKDCVLVCGVAGACNDKNMQVLSEFVGGEYSQKLITSDARISLYGAGKGTPIIVAAIGTGSVAMKLDEKGREAIVGGWGFVAGDLGSGAEIGRQLVTKVLIEFDKKQRVYDPIVNQVLNLIGDQRQTILAWLKTASPSDYAKLAPIVFAGFMGSKIAKQIIDSAVKDIEDLVESFNHDAHLPVAIIGGLSNQIVSLLTDNLQQRLIKPKGSAIDGAFYLAEQLILKKQSAKNIQSY